MFKAVPLAAMVEQNIKYQKICREYELLSKAFEVPGVNPEASGFSQGRFTCVPQSQQTPMWCCRWQNWP